ncbi:malate synthase G [Pseudarthrobacter sp. MDT3-28]|uniref:malate synthase G n=1 Tax=Pseudarthrobacter raffinosi TaxID=2953651 RepID=UPI00208EC9FB|nr:malate synthase G [Pseudarthrobacter sp. MDT3-28]MCO4239236.1 malate synthase G [Pseudarthrobacter sp. MDT3-28]
MAGQQKKWQRPTSTKFLFSAQQAYLSEIQKKEHPMSTRIKVSGLSVAEPLLDFVDKVALPGTGISPEEFWAGAASIFRDLTPRNRELLEIRDDFQERIDAYHRRSPGPVDSSDYAQFLRKIGYLVDDFDDVTISPSRVDVEITNQPGPQLVVPLLNRRFVANAVNARWGSLYDAFYGTDAIDQSDELAPGSSYNPVRGRAVVTEGRRVLDMCAPLNEGSHSGAVAYSVAAGDLLITLAGGKTTSLVKQNGFVGYRGNPQNPGALLFVHHGLHIEVVVDRHDPVGAADAAGVKDILLESAVTTIMDLEDSVAAVTAEDKVLGYRNWLELMQGTLSEKVVKDGVLTERKMLADREYTARDGQPRRLRGRSLLFIRQVGHLMTTDSVLDEEGNEVPEGILDAIITAVGSLHDLEKLGTLRNSQMGSMYVVKPKMHGPDEVAFTVALFERVERLLKMEPKTIKLGIMDEERRTSVNLRACIRAASERIVFINTGFLDRTGDEIRTSTFAGAFVRKAEMKHEQWIAAYEAQNVRIGLAAGFSGLAQIGKGMWAMPDLMSAMLKQKIGQPRSGATTSWVPSPTAATLHALHYHEVDVFEVHRVMSPTNPAEGEEILTLPLAPTNYSDDEIHEELDNNLQSILGYVVRWIDQGIGCSKVPDVHNIALMEDRATCRISSQHVANWVLHGIVSIDQVESALRRMAAVVDDQNSKDPSYIPMGPAFDGDAFLAARALVLEGTSQPNGYTEPILHKYRRAAIIANEPQLAGS